MSELDILSDALAKVLNPEAVQRRTLACDPGALDVATLDELASFGLGGSAAAELSLDMLAEVMRSLGRAAALTPIVDSEILARWLAVGAGLETDPDEILTIAVCEPAENGVIDLRAIRFPNGRHAGHALLSFTSAGTDLVAMVPCSDLHLEPGTNLAGEARERSGVAGLRFADLGAKPVGQEFSPEAVMRRGAFCRVAAMLGAAERVQDLTIRYAGERVQFGRALSKFQMIQSYVAELAAEIAAASAMFELAMAALEDEPGDSAPEIAAMKIRAGMMARTVTALAHQIHGTMGFTREYPLHLWTRRLWSWREEYGNEATWSEALGEQMIAAGGDGFWDRVAR